MQEVTDPATELTDLCDRLSQDVDMRGDDYLAKEFNVKKDSREFYRLLTTILDRIAVLEAIISTLPLEAADVNEAKNDLNKIAGAFRVAHLAANWKAPNGPHHLRRENTRFLRGLRSQVSRVESYPVLTEAEIADFLSNASELEVQLHSAQTVEPDFIRKALLTGIAEFRFCIERLRWVGWVHTRESIDRLIHADVGPLAPAFNQRVLLLNTSWFSVWRARRARSRQRAQALGARTPGIVRSEPNAA